MIRRAIARPFVAELWGIALLVAIGAVTLPWTEFGGLPAPAQVLPTSLCTLGAGMFLATLAARGSQEHDFARRLERLGRPAHWWWLAAAAVFTAQCLVPYGFFLATAGEIVRDQYLRVPVAFFMVVPGVFGTGGWIRRMLASAPFVFFGVVSYGIYLWHTAVINEFHTYSAIPKDLQFVAAFVVTVAVATASWYLLERPMQRLAHRRTRERVS